MLGQGQFHESGQKNQRAETDAEFGISAQSCCPSFRDEDGQVSFSAPCLPSSLTPQASLSATASQQGQDTVLPCWCQPAGETDEAPVLSSGQCGLRVCRASTRFGD